MKRRRIKVLVVLAILVLAPVIAITILYVHRKHARERDAQDREHAANLGPVVLVATVEMTPAERDLVLPADVRGIFQASVYAKVSGYVRELTVDKGDSVRKGQLVGRIESPETDQALAQARADLLLRQKEVKRAQSLAPAVMSQAELETAQSNVRVAEANLVRAEEMKRYEDLRAPFDGIVTARYVDPGALLPAATGGTTAALPIVDVADPRTLRVQVFVGDDAAQFVKPGDEVTIWEDARPDRKIPAVVARTAGALDPRTRTMLAEVELDNRTLGLLPGTFAHERIVLRSPPRPLVPTEAVLVRGGSTFVGTVADGHVHITRVVTGITDGRVVQITSGLKGGETVALNLPTEVDDGAPVQAKAAPPQSPQSPAAPSPSSSGRPPGTSARHPPPGR